MPVTLKQKTDEVIVAARDMKDGQIGVIVKWGDSNLSSSLIGRVVQKYATSLIVIGMTSGHSFGDTRKWEDCYQVRLLKKGEILEIEQ